jgi:outer membrane protein assembly factor BamB
LYIPSSFSLFSRNAADGSVNWNYTSAGNIVNPQLKDDTLITASALIAPSASNAIVLINKNTGNVIWSKSVNDEPAVTPVLSEGKIYNLTVNGTGSVVTISAYDVATQNLLWQKILANAFFAPAPLDMMVRHDSLIVFSSPATLHVINKNNGNLYWSKSNAAYTLLKYKNDLAFNDNNTGQVKVISLQTGNIILQSAPITYTSTFRGYSYIYNDAFYHVVFDSVFCTSLIDGLLKWRKKYETSLQGFFLKLIPVGNTVYGYRTYDNANDQSKLMILNALDFTARDSIIIPKREFSNFSVLSASGIIY